MGEKAYAVSKNKDKWLCFADQRDVWFSVSSFVSLLPTTLLGSLPQARFPSSHPSGLQVLPCQGASPQGRGTAPSIAQIIFRDSVLLPRVQRLLHTSLSSKSWCSSMAALWMFHVIITGSKLPRDHCCSFLFWKSSKQRFNN